MSIDDMARLIVRSDDVTNEAPLERRREGGLAVPWSARAALLAGAATACLSAGFLLTQESGSHSTSGDLNQVASIIGIDPRATGPALLFLSLWQAAQSTSFTLLGTHFVSKWTREVGVSAFTIGGAATGLVLAAVCQLLGFGGPEHGYLYEALMGGCAGLIYRRLAGLKPIS
jgi:hypothetical protein